MASKEAKSADWQDGTSQKFLCSLSGYIFLYHIFLDSF
jgi:hypothetical protein